MQHLETLTQLVNAASTLAEFAHSAQTYSFHVASGSSCYVHVAGGELRIARHDSPLVIVTAQLQAPFGWRIAAEQDSAGVYFVALRRAVVGAIADASFRVSVPYDTHLTLKLDRTRLCLENVEGLFEFPAQAATLMIAPRLNMSSR